MIKYTLLWPNNEITTGRTFRELEDAIRASQWSPYATRREFRNEMLTRAKVWSGKIVPPIKTSEDLIMGLRDVGMYMLFKEEEDA